MADREDNEVEKEVMASSSPPPLRLDKKVTRSGRERGKGEVFSGGVKKNLLYALLMSVVPGLGHFYLGSPRMGLIFSAWLSLSVMVLAFFLLWGLGEFEGSVALGILFVGVISWVLGYVLVYVDVVRSFALKGGRESMTAPWQWSCFSVLTLVAIVSFLLTPNFGMMRAEDDAMLPLVGKGDYFLYDLEVSSQSRGDVIVYDPPEGKGGERSVLRVMATERDQIKVTNEIVYVNGKPLLKARSPEGSLKTEGGEAFLYLERYVEEGKVLKSYDVLELTNVAPHDSTRTFFVPPGHIFVMGDNRDESLDSRYADRFGFLSVDNVVGRPILTLSSSEGSRVGASFN